MLGKANPKGLAICACAKTDAAEAMIIILVMIRFHRDLTVQKVLETWPSTRAVFIRRRMACIGCALAPFMTIGEAAVSYGIPPDDLEQDLRAMAAQPPEQSS